MGTWGTRAMMYQQDPQAYLSQISGAAGRAGWNPTQVTNQFGSGITVPQGSASSQAIANFANNPPQTPQSAPVSPTQPVLTAPPGMQPNPQAVASPTPGVQTYGGGQSTRGGAIGPNPMFVTSGIAPTSYADVYGPNYASYAGQAGANATYDPNALANSMLNKGATVTPAATLANQPRIAPPPVTPTMTTAPGTAVLGVNRR